MTVFCTSRMVCQTSGETVLCGKKAENFFIDKYGRLWPRCEGHSIGWAPGGSEKIRVISLEEFIILQVQNS